MDYTHLGRSGLSVSRLCLGTMNFGPHTSQADSFAIMDSAHEHGLNFFDTANVYGQGEGRGATETIVGNWFAQGGGRRRLQGRAQDAVETHGSRIQEWEDFADELGHEPGDVALAWLLHQPAVTAPIIGPRTQEQLDAALRALDVTLDDQALARLDEIFPGYETAPEHYAW